MHELEALAIHATTLLTREVNKIIGFDPGSFAKVSKDDEKVIIEAANGDGNLKEGQVYAVDIDYGNPFQALNHADSQIIFRPKKPPPAHDRKKHLILNAGQANTWRSMEFATLVLAYIVANSKLEFELDPSTRPPLSPPAPARDHSDNGKVVISLISDEEEEVDVIKVVNSDGTESQKRRRSRDEVQKQREVGFKDITERLSRNKHVATKIVAEYLGFSMYHFHRSFLVYVGVTVQEYTNICGNIYSKNKKTFLRIKRMIDKRTFKSIGIDSLLVNHGETLRVMGSQINMERPEKAELFKRDCSVIPEQQCAKTKRAKSAIKSRQNHGSNDRTARSGLIKDNLSFIAPFRHPQFYLEKYQQRHNNMMHSNFVSSANTNEITVNPMLLGNITVTADTNNNSIRGASTSTMWDANASTMSGPGCEGTRYNDTIAAETVPITELPLQDSSRLFAGTDLYSSFEEMSSLEFESLSDVTGANTSAGNITYEELEAFLLEGTEGCDDATLAAMMLEKPWPPLNTNSDSQASRKSKSKSKAKPKANLKPKSKPKSKSKAKTRVLANKNNASQFAALLENHNSFANPIVVEPVCTDKQGVQVQKVRFADELLTTKSETELFIEECTRIFDMPHFELFSEEVKPHSSDETTPEQNNPSQNNLFKEVIETGHWKEIEDLTMMSLFDGTTDINTTPDYDPFAKLTMDVPKHPI